MTKITRRSRLWMFLLLAGILFSTFPNSVEAWGFPRTEPQLQKTPDRVPAPLGREQGTLALDTPDFTLRLVRDSQTVAALQPKGAGNFDFTPADRLQSRAGNGFHHLGDLILRVRRGTSGDWQELDTAAARLPVRPLPVSGNTLAAADLTPTLPADCPLQITRSWSLEKGRLALHFTLKNNTTAPLQIGALGLPMVFNNILTDRSLQEAHEKCVFFDPYIGQDGGYLQVTRLNGQGPALVVVPEAKTPFEAYSLLREPTRPNQTFEGTFAWMVHSQAYAEKEWRNAAPWNPPTLATLAPGETRTYGVRFLLADQIRHLEATLTANQRPVAVGIPGYVLPMDTDGKLFLNYRRTVAAVTVEPKDAITVHEDKPTRNGWKAYSLRGRNWGRARLTVTYADGLRQSVSYYVIKPAAQVAADLGRFLTTRQWFVAPNDPFHRSPSVMSYDRQADRIVSQDSRVWIAGLGDEGGSGSWLAAAMKEFGQPNREELAKYEQFVDQVLWGGIQFKDGPNKYGVRKSLFYYEPKTLPDYPYDQARDWRSWTSWNRQASEDIGRGYNYPHVVAAYWAIYRAARNNPGIVQNHPWDWYLEQAYQTTQFMFSRDASGNRRVGYVELGLMEGDIFLAVLADLKHEGWTAKAAVIEALMKERTERWKQEEYPFGSEMAWDSTGQEEVYAWCDYFGYRDKALVSLNSILGYMPTLPHWGYNGNARRYWDFLYGGKLSRIERQIHHYGSGLNAIPVLTAYRQNPDDFYLLRVGYGGLLGALTNIDREGFASVAFHSFPATLQWDAYSGDYGPNFFGHAYNTGTYLVSHPEFGWQAFGGNVKVEGNRVRVEVCDSLRKRVYVAPHRLWLTLDAGTFTVVEVDTRTAEVRVGIAPATQYGKQALLRVEQPAPRKGDRAYFPAKALQSERDAYVVPLGTSTTWVVLTNTPPAREDKLQMKVIGDWQIQISPGVVTRGKTRIRIPQAVTLDIAPATLVRVRDEKYDSLPLFDANAAPWGKGAKLRQLTTFETTAAGSLVPESLVLKSGSGTAPHYTAGKDYALEPQWATFGRLPNGVPEGQPVWADYDCGWGRIDTIAVGPKGTLTLRQGTPHNATPHPPTLEKGELPLANVWIPARLPKLTADNLYPILEPTYPEPKAQPKPTAAGLLPKTWAKLQAGQPVHILAWGDSVTDGGQASDAAHQYQSRFVTLLKARFPKSPLRLTTAAWGGRNSDSFLNEPPGSKYNFAEAVLAPHPDLIVMEFVNDAWMTPEVVEQKYAALLKRFQEIGAEWVILTPHFVRPDWMGQNSGRVETDPRPYVAAVRAFAAKHNVALADASLRWGHLLKQGIPYTTLLSNSINHPDDRGHELFAQALLALFR